MIFLSWFSIVTLLILLGLYLFWVWQEGQASWIWVRLSFYGGVVLFMGLFLILTWHTLSVIPERTHAETLTPAVVAGKLVWQKYVCIDCHTLLGNGAYYGPDLTKTWDRFVARSGGDDAAARAAMVGFITNPPQATSERRGMPKLGISGEEAEQLVAFFGWLARIDTNGWPPAPIMPVGQAVPSDLKGVSALAAQGKELLSRRGCLGCHSIGGGRVIGPDLIGVAAKYARDSLVRWIHDPQGIYRERGHKPLNAGYAEMPDLNISQQEAEAIAAYLLSLRN